MDPPQASLAGARVSLLLAAAVLSQVQVRESPKDWKKIVTAHFDLYYPGEEFLPRAREFAAWFEEARQDLGKEFAVEIPRVSVFLYGSYHDLAQASFLAKPPLSTLLGMKATGGRPAERLRRARCHPELGARAFALAEPLRDRIFIHCQSSDRWNRSFARHELAHQLQFEGLFKFRMPSLWVAFQDPLIPAWFWEGGADRMAGAESGGTREYLRDLAGERLYTLAELFSTDALPDVDDRAVYIEGAAFLGFLEETFGAGTLAKLLAAYGDALSVDADGPLEAVTGRTRADLEREFGASLERRFRAEREGREPPRDADRLTDVRAFYRPQAWGGRRSPDGKHVAWTGNRDVWPELYVDGKGLLGLGRGLEGRVVSAPSWSPDGRRLAVIEEVTGHDHLLLVSLDGGECDRIDLELDELADPAWHPDGRSIAVSGMKGGRSHLYRLHLDGRRLEQLTSGDAGDVSPAYAPDGTLAWIREEEGRTVLHVAGRGPVTRSWAELRHPRWTPDGKGVVLAADVGGVFDAFRVDPASGKALRLTRLRDGVSYPELGPGGELLFTYESRRTRDLFQITPEAREAPEFDEEARRETYAPYRRPVPQGEPAEKTRDWGVNFFAAPVTGTPPVLPGLELVVGDLEAENTISFAARGVSSRYWTASALAENARYWPTLSLGAEAGRLGELAEAKAGPAVELGFWSVIAARLSWTGRYRTEIEKGGDGPHFFDSGPTASFRFSNQELRGAFDPAWGYAFGASASAFRKALGGERDLEEFSGYAEASGELEHDVILWGRLAAEQLRSRDLLEDEALKIREVVRGARGLEGPVRGVASVELRFPIYRELFWAPLEELGLGGFLLLKDLRGFGFAQAGAAGPDPGGGREYSLARSAGVGLRVDCSVMPWPVLNARIPTRVEVWWACVTQEGRATRGVVGAGFQMAF